MFAGMVVYSIWQLWTLPFRLPFARIMHPKSGLVAFVPRR
jgi:hypothetical protein